MSLGESSEAASGHGKFQRRLAQKVCFPFFFFSSFQIMFMVEPTAFVQFCGWKLLLIIPSIQLSMVMLLRELWHFDSLKIFFCLISKQRMKGYKCFVEDKIK